MDVKSLTVENLVRKFSLKVLVGKNQLQQTITQSRAHRPGLEFVGHFDFFPTERVQILGKKEITFLRQKNSLNNELENEPEFTEYMDVRISHIEIQLQPGRDVAGLIEAAAVNKAD